VFITLNKQETESMVQIDPLLAIDPPRPAIFNMLLQQEDDVLASIAHAEPPSVCCPC
jgi:hypothetical protein